MKIKECQKPFHSFWHFLPLSFSFYLFISPHFELFSNLSFYIYASFCFYSGSNSWYSLSNLFLYLLISLLVHTSIFNFYLSFSLSFLYLYILFFLSVLNLLFPTFHQIHDHCQNKILFRAYRFTLVRFFLFWLNCSLRKSKKSIFFVLFQFLFSRFLQ